jgi:FkbM family methyltransferase
MIKKVVDFLSFLFEVATKRYLIYPLNFSFKVKNFWDYFFDLFGLTKGKKIVYELRNGLRFLVRSGTMDKDVIATSVLLDEYKLNEMNLFNATIVDVGAHIGVFSVFASRKGKVYSLEPVKENFELLLENIELNNLQKKIVPFNLAVSKKSGKRRIFLAENNTGGHSFYGNGKCIEVNSVSLENFFDQNKIRECDLLKLDIEGTEYEVLYFLPDRILARIKRISMECHFLDKKRNSFALIRFLQSKGFKIKFSDPVLLAERN